MTRPIRFEDALAARGGDGYAGQSWPLVWERADTFADGLATRSCYELTFTALREGLSNIDAETLRRVVNGEI
jgi:hypothetical protein